MVDMNLSMPVTSRAVAFIRLQNLIHNFQVVRQLAAGSRVLAMVKADAYGHGITKVAHALKDADAFGVHCLQEGLRLREAGIRQPIVLMVGFIHHDELSVIAEQQLDVVVHNQYQINSLSQAHLAAPINVWLKVNTGMNRLGFYPDEIRAIHQQLKHVSHVKQLRLLTHFAYADEHNQEKTQQQVNQLVELTIDAEKSFANSAAIFECPYAHADWVRPGIMLYGASPFPDKVGKELGLKPVMELRSRLIAVHQQQAGDQIGYSGTWTCPEKMRVGVVSIGYGDGYPRHIKNGAPIIVAGQPAKIVGRLSMDMLTVDLRGCDKAEVGAEVELWGDQLPVERVAEHAGTISYELFCNTNKRVEFIYC